MVTAFASLREILDLKEFCWHGVYAYVVKLVAYSGFIKVVNRNGAVQPGTSGVKRENILYIYLHRHRLGQN